MPSDWRIRDVNDLVQDGRPICYGVLKPGDYFPDGVPLIRIVDMDGDAVREDQLFRISNALDKAFARSRLAGGEILISIQGTVGRVALVSKRLAGANISRTIARVAIGPDAAPSYVRQWFLSADGQRALDDSVVGTTRSSLNIGVLRRIRLPVPPLPEQRGIAEILDTLDAAILKTEQVIAKLQQMKQGLLHDLLTRGIDDNGELRDAERHPEQFKNSPLGCVPRHWKVEPLGDLVRKHRGFIQTGPFGSQLHAHEYTAAGVPIVMPQDIGPDHISEAQIARISHRRAEDLGRHRMESNDAVFARRGDLTRCAAVSTREIRWLCGTGCLLVRVHKDILDARWLTAIYRHEIGQRQVRERAVGSTMVNLNTSILSRLVIPVPTPEEQRAVCDRVASVVDRLGLEQDQLAKLIRVKRGLADDLLAGRVRVTVADEAAA